MEFSLRNNAITSTAHVVAEDPHKLLPQNSLVLSGSIVFSNVSPWLDSGCSAQQSYPTQYMCFLLLIKNYFKPGGNIYITFHGNNFTLVYIKVRLILRLRFYNDLSIYFGAIYLATLFQNLVEILQVRNVVLNIGIYFLCSSSCKCFHPACIKILYNFSSDL